MELRGKGHAKTVWITPDDERRTDRLMDLGLATTASEAIRVALALAMIAVDRMGLTHSL